MTAPIEKYTAIVIQPEITVAEDRDGIQLNLDRVCNMIDFGVGYSWELPVGGCRSWRRILPFESSC